MRMRWTLLLCPLRSMERTLQTSLRELFHLEQFSHRHLLLQCSIAFLSRGCSTLLRQASRVTFSFTMPRAKVCIEDNPKYYKGLLYELSKKRGFGCRDTRRYIGPNGYAGVVVHWRNGRSKKIGVHRLAAILNSGDLRDPEDLEASHLCGRRTCVKRSHLVFEPRNVNLTRWFCKYFHKHPEFKCLHTPKCRVKSLPHA